MDWMGVTCAEDMTSKIPMALMWICFATGCWKYAQWAYWLLLQLFCNCRCLCKANLSKYRRNKVKDDGTWAVITGGSDGIGFELCKQMADQGFNTVMMARNQDKMDVRVKELSESYPDVQHASVKVDFSKLKSMQEYRDLISKGLDGKDVGFVALNAGLGRAGSNHKIPDSALEEVMTVNTLHVVFMAKIFLEMMMKREQKSAMVFVSSIASRMVFPGWASYSATKAFVTNLGNSVYYEVKDKVDVLVWTPGVIKTAFAENFT